ncbi:hypothetical protein [Enterococcus rotai]|uniref:hypothetical protein n=1 Tax=Enterococcus rotai TaxID=118060 RepID=UPI0032B5B474
MDRQEVLTRIEQFVFKEVSLKYKGSDLQERFRQLFLLSDSYYRLKARLSAGDMEMCDLGQVHELEDTYGEYISEEVLKSLRNIPSLTIEEYLARVKKDVSDYVLSKTNLTVDQFEKKFLDSENFALSVSSAKKWADEDGVIRSDIMETLIAGDYDAIVKEIM